LPFLPPWPCPRPWFLLVRTASSDRDSSIWGRSYFMSVSHLFRSSDIDPSFYAQGHCPSSGRSCGERPPPPMAQEHATSAVSTGSIHRRPGQHGPPAARVQQACRTGSMRHRGTRSWRCRAGKHSGAQPPHRRCRQRPRPHRTVGYAPTARPGGASQVGIGVPSSPRVPRPRGRLLPPGDEALQ
jgi:hypothetical protein